MELRMTDLMITVRKIQDLKKGRKFISRGSKNRKKSSGEACGSRNIILQCNALTIHKYANSYNY